jgi:hypothetical protein
MSNRDSLLSLFKEQLENESGSIAKDRNLDKRGDFLIWWYFLKLWKLPTSDVEEALCDDGNDLGLDAVYIDEDNVVHFFQFKNPQNKEKALPEGEVDSVISGLHLILNKRHEEVANEDLKGRLDEIYQIVPSGYRLYLVTSGTGIFACPAFTDCLPLSHSTSSHPSFLVLGGAEMPYCGVPSAGVVEALYVLEDRRPSSLTVRP